jgi:predicted Fe-Mo cluster-binding NifX family protein
MGKIRIAIGSNDEKNIAKSHLGDTEFFYIYDITDDKEYKFIKKCPNSAKTIQHAKLNKMEQILETLQDVDMLISFQLSPNFKKIAANTKFQPVVIKGKSFEEILSILIDNKEQLNRYVEKRKNGEFSAEIPEF